MKLWRCENPDCSEAAVGAAAFDFAAEKAECPKCGGGKEVVTERIVIHLLVPDKAGPVTTAAGRRRIACQPAAKWCGKKEQMSGVLDAVTCPTCLASAAAAESADDTTMVKESDRLAARLVKDQMAKG